MTMKFWELDSIFRGERQQALEKMLSDKRWQNFKNDLAIIDDLITRQDRSKLDQEIPESLMIEALEQLDSTFVIKRNHLMLADAGEQGLSAVEVARRFGGSIIEDVQEYGSVPVPEN